MPRRYGQMETVGYRIGGEEGRQKSFADSKTEGADVVILATTSKTISEHNNIKI